MDMIKSLIETLYWFLQPGNWGTIAAVAGGLGFVIFVHELGHFLAAKSCGVRCDKFYIGFDMPLGKMLDWVISLPLRLFKRDAQISFFQKFIPSSLFKYKKGETLYGIGIIPLGGYVKMLGQEDNPAMAAEEMKILEQQRKNGVPNDPNVPQLSPQRVAELTDPRSYVTKTVPQRMLIITAGVIMNVIFAFIMATVAYLYGVKTPPAEIGGVYAGGAGWEAGMRAGDTIKKINDEEIKYFEDMKTHVVFRSTIGGDGIPFDIERVGSDNKIKSERLIIKPRNDKGAPMVLVTGPHSLELGGFPDDDAKRKLIHNADLVGTVIADPDSKTSSASLPKVDEKLLRLKDGDKIISVDGQKPATYVEYLNLMAKLADKPVKMVVKSKMPKSSDATKSDTARSAESASQPEDQAEEKHVPFWMEFTVPPMPRRELGIEVTLGKIQSIQSNSPAADAKLLKGDKVLKFNGQPIGNPETLEKRLKEFVGKEITLSIERKIVVKADEKKSDKDDKAKKTPVEVLDVKITPRAVDWIEETFEGMAFPSLGICCNLDPIVSAIKPGSPAEKAGIKPGQFIESAQLSTPAEPLPGKLFRKPSPKMEFETEESGKPGDSWVVLREALPFAQRSQTVKLKVKPISAETTSNDSKSKDAESDKGKELELEPVDSTDDFVFDRGLDFKQKEVDVDIDGFFDGVKHGAAVTWDNLTKVVGFLKKLRNNEISARLLGGPVTIATQAGYAATSGFSQLLLFLTMLSANLAVVNILPVPVLDGGHVVFLLYEGITGKPPNARVFEFLTMIGFLCLLSLMIFVLGLDFGLISRK